MILNDKELNNISGGGISWSIIAGIGMLITLIVGVADGYVRPLKCN